MNVTSSMALKLVQCGTVDCVYYSRGNLYDNIFRGSPQMAHAIVRIFIRAMPITAD